MNKLLTITLIAVFVALASAAACDTTKKPEGCTSCTTLGGLDCNTCDTGYTLDSTNHVCKKNDPPAPKCEAENCRTCKDGDNKYCVACNDGFVDNLGHCYTKCDLSDCTKCATIDKKSVCLDACTVNGCKTCEKSPKTCDVCMDNSTLAQNQCFPKCNLTDCGACATINGKNVCVDACEDKACKDCSTNPKVCLTCDDTHHVLEGKCYANCTGNTVKDCTKCANVNGTDACIDCNVPNCAKCALNNATFCDSCNLNFSKSDKSNRCFDSSFVACEGTVKDCEKCMAGNKTQCGACNVQFYKNGTDCKKCIAGCDLCDTADTCVRCADGHKYNATLHKCSGMRNGITLGAVVVALFALLF